MTFKNYKELCLFLDMPVRSGTSGKKSQLKELDRYCMYIKNGQKFIITKIFDIPLEKIDHRGTRTKRTRNTIYKRIRE